MSDNDLIKYGDVRVKVESAIEVLNNLGLTWGIYSPLWDAIDAIRDIPAVPQEMSAREYGETLMKICASHKGRCYKCELGGAPCAIPDERTSPIVEKWARERPEERSEE